MVLGSFGQFWAVCCFSSHPTMTPFLCKLGPKKPFLGGFTNFFFRTNRLQHKLLILIESPNMFHWKSANKSKVDVVFGAKFGPN